MAYGQFSKILQTSPFVCKKKEIDQYGRNVYSNILSPYIMEVFGVQGILNLSEKQKQILSQIDCRDKKTIYRVKLFMEKNPNYSGNLHFSKDILDVLEDERITDLSPEEENIYNKASSINVTKRVKELGDEGFSFIGKEDILNPTVMKVLSDKEILELTPKEVERIKRLLNDNAHLLELDKDAIEKEIKKIANRKSIIENMKKRIFL